MGSFRISSPYYVDISALESTIFQSHLLFRGAAGAKPPPDETPDESSGPSAIPRIADARP
jgi:hypothetical protein